MRDLTPEERLGRLVIGAAAFAAALLAAWHVGAGAGRPQPLLAHQPWKHSVAFRARELQQPSRGD